jgi:pimeloyl-ACP methyl ester carboxylesterase
MFYKRPDLFTDICLIDSPGVTYDKALLDVLCTQEKVKTVDEIFVVKDLNALERLYDLAFYKKQRIPKSVLKDAYDLYFAENHEELKGLIHSLQNNTDDYLAQELIKFPNSAVIWGENDAVFPLSEGEKVAKFMGAKMHVVTDAGHAPNIENFKEFESLLRAWLSGN